MSETLKQRKLVLNILWGAMLWAVILYCGIHYMMVRAERPAAGTPALWYGMIAAACAALLGGWMWHGVMLRGINEQITPTVFQRLGPSERTALQARVQAVVIVTMAFFEAAVVIGLVLTILGCPIPYVFHGLAAAGILCLVLYRIQGFHEVFAALDKLDVRAPGT